LGHLADVDTVEVTRRIEDQVESEIRGLLAAVESLGSACIVVSSEVGLGIVPEYPLARVYRDALGRANQLLAADADAVYLMVAGIPVDVKALSSAQPS
jgi:adenosylcobinamide kinase / adenosylcobinamide-phosphate guanylyltransferase